MRGKYEQSKKGVFLVRKGSYTTFNIAKIRKIWSMTNKVIRNFSRENGNFLPKITSFRNLGPRKKLSVLPQTRRQVSVTGAVVGSASIRFWIVPLKRRYIHVHLYDEYEWICRSKMGSGRNTNEGYRRMELSREFRGRNITGGRHMKQEKKEEGVKRGGKRGVRNVWVRKRIRWNTEKEWVEMTEGWREWEGVGVTFWSFPLPIWTTPTLTATLSPPGTLEFGPELLLIPLWKPPLIRRSARE